MNPIAVFPYTEIREEGGKRFLFDARNYNKFSGRVDRLAAILPALRAILQKYDYPDTEEWQRAIMKGGEEGFKEIVLSENDKQAARLGIPRYVAQQWRKSAIADIPDDMLREIVNFSNEYKNAAEGLPIVPADISFKKDGTPVLKSADIKARIKAGYTLDITPEMEAEAEKVRALIPTLREIDAAGVDILKVAAELMGNFITPHKYPALDDFRVISAISRARHQTREQLKASDPEYFYQVGGRDYDEEAGQ